MLLRYIDSRHSVACLKKNTSHNLCCTYRKSYFARLKYTCQPPELCSRLSFSNLQRILKNINSGQVFKFAFVRGAEALSPSQAVPVLGALEREEQYWDHCISSPCGPCPGPSEGIQRIVSYLLCFTYRAEKIQRKRESSRYHTHVKETDLMTSHRVEAYHLPDSLCVLMASFVLSCRHFGPARLNIALVLTLHDFKTKKLWACGQEKPSNILLSIFHFFPLCHSSPLTINCWVFCMFHN